MKARSFFLRNASLRTMCQAAPSVFSLHFSSDTGIGCEHHYEAAEHWRPSPDTGNERRNNLQRSDRLSAQRSQDCGTFLQPQDQQRKRREIVAATLDFQEGKYFVANFCRICLRNQYWRLALYFEQEHL